MMSYEHYNQISALTMSIITSVQCIQQFDTWITFLHHYIHKLHIFKMVQIFSQPSRWTKVTLPTCHVSWSSVDVDELNKRKVNRQKRMKLEMRHASRIRRQENRQMGFGEYWWWWYQWDKIWTWNVNLVQVVDVITHDDVIRLTIGSCMWVVCLSHRAKQGIVNPDHVSE